jgi:hypothetical protein
MYQLAGQSRRGSGTCVVCMECRLAVSGDSLSKFPAKCGAEGNYFVGKRESMGGWMKSFNRRGLSRSRTGAAVYVEA